MFVVAIRPLIGQCGLIVEVASPLVALACTWQPASAFSRGQSENMLTRSHSLCLFIGLANWRTNLIPNVKSHTEEGNQPTKLNVNLQTLSLNIRAFITSGRFSSVMLLSKVSLCAGLFVFFYECLFTSNHQITLLYICCVLASNGTHFLLCRALFSILPQPF